ncbi:MAG: hypothetical protein ABIF40_02050 [archaeon]
MKLAILDYPTASYGNNWTLDGFLTIIEKLSEENYNLIACPEWGLFFRDSNHPRITTTSEKSDLVEVLCDFSKGKTQLILPGSMMWLANDTDVYNTVPIIGDGKYLGDYHKYIDGGSTNAVLQGMRREPGLSQRKGFGWKPGNEKGKYFRWNNLDCGIEICADTNSYRNLRKNMLIPKLDLQFLISCGMPLIPANTKLKRGGIGIGIDGHYPIQNYNFTKKPLKQFRLIRRNPNFFRFLDLDLKYQNIESYEIEPLTVSKKGDLGVYVHKFEVKI